MFTLVGSGPGAAAAEETLTDRVSDVRTDIETVGDATVAVVVGPAGDTRFKRANELALAGDTTWFAVELGGVGGTRLSMPPSRSLHPTERVTAVFARG